MTAANQSSTFLFTDIEGSTRLWSRSPVAMAAAVPRQEALLRQLIGEHGGSVFKSVGDGVYAVFPKAAHAVRAAVAAQRRLLSEPWDGFDMRDPLLVRIALHTGAAEARAGDYFGPTLNRLSRTLAAGHGGQVLCTDDTLAACGEDWPEGIGWRDLGERTLRDVPGSGRIVQLVAEGLPEHFPPLTTLDPRMHNLPRWPSPMVGRDADADRLRSSLRTRGTRMVTVLGTGGVGKTRLATEVAEQMLDEFQDGIRFVDLSALREDAQVAPAIVQVTGAADQLLTPADALLEWLRDRALLLVLDNCEQVIAGVASICSEIVLTAPGVTVLATSRLPIRIRGERLLALEPLPLPGAGPDPATANPAVALFAARAREVNESFTLDQDTASDVAEICRLVDGLPLAIELAAAWVRLLSPAALHRRLQENSAILRDGARDLPDRQRTLTNTIAWSYDLLEPEDQRAFRRLAVFRGGIAVDAAAAVIWEAPITDPLWALSRLDALVQAHLLQVAPDPAGEPRFLMLQTIQEFAVGVLRASGEWEDAASAHAGFFSGLAAEAQPHYRTENVAHWLDRLDANVENLRAAVTWLGSSTSASPDAALEMATQLWEYFDLRNRHPEARALLASALDAATPQPSELHVRALALLGHTWLNDYEQAEIYYRRSIEMAAGIPDAEPPFEAITGRMVLAGMKGDISAGILLANDLLHHARSSGRPAMVAQVLLTLGQFLADGGESEAALKCWSESRGIAKQLGDHVGLAWIQRAKGEMHFAQGNYDEANYLMLQAIDALEPLGERQVIALCQLDVALIAALRSDRDNAVAYLTSAVDEIAVGGIVLSAWDAIKTGAIVLTLVLDQPAVATELFSAADAWSSATGTVERPQRQALVTGIRQTASTSSAESARFDPTSPLSLREAIELLQKSLRDTATTPDRPTDLAVER